VQLIYGLDCQYWGKGLATEMGRAMLEYGFHQLGFVTICASTDPPNRASIAVLERLGMTVEKQVIIDGRDTIFYRIEQEQFS
jgi:ribosomal-protein-alanine N-acetyltransferase